MIWEFYKKVIAETIWAARKNFGEGFMCKSMVAMYLAAINLMNYGLLFFFISDFFGVMIDIEIFNTQVFNGYVDEKIINFLNYIMPFAMINYFIIFHKKRYKKILKQYPKPGIKYVMTYTWGSFILFMGYIVIGKLMA